MLRILRWGRAHVRPDTRLYWLIVSLIFWRLYRLHGLTSENAW